MQISYKFLNEQDTIAKEDVPTWCKQFYYDFIS